MEITDEDIQTIILSLSGDFLFHIGESLEFQHYDGLMPQEEQYRLYRALQIWIKKSAGEFKQIQEG